jgi:predicted Zn-dependent protease with MMP-like domain
MTRDDFEQVVAEAYALVPEKFRAKVKNVALLVEDEPDEETREAEGLGEEDTLLGLYRGVPMTERGEGYGVGMTLPDTITIYRLPTLDEAWERAMDDGHHISGDDDPVFIEEVRNVVRETIWHEIAHYFGMDEHNVGRREDEGTNEYRTEDR